MLLSLLVAQASAQSIAIPAPDLHVSDRECLPGTGGFIPCVEMYAYSVDITDVLIDMELSSFSVNPGLQWWQVDGALTSSVNDAQNPFQIQVYTSVGGLIGIQQTCDGWVQPFTVTAGVDAQVIVRPFQGTMDIEVPPLDSDFSDLDGGDIVLTGQGLDCTVGAIDAALGAIPGMNLDVFDFIVWAIVPIMESTIEGMNDELEAILDSLV